MWARGWAGCCVHRRHPLHCGLWSILRGISNRHVPSTGGDPWGTATVNPRLLWSWVHGQEPQVRCDSGAEEHGSGRQAGMGQGTAWQGTANRSINNCWGIHVQSIHEGAWEQCPGSRWQGRWCHCYNGCNTCQERCVLNTVKVEEWLCAILTSVYPCRSYVAVHHCWFSVCCVMPRPGPCQCLYVFAVNQSCYFLPFVDFISMMSHLLIRGLFWYCVTMHVHKTS